MLFDAVMHFGALMLFMRLVHLYSKSVNIRALIITIQIKLCGGRLQSVIHTLVICRKIFYKNKTTYFLTLTLFFRSWAISAFFLIYSYTSLGSLKTQTKTESLITVLGSLLSTFYLLMEKNMFQEKGLTEPKS